ncbi:MAG TPA: porin [Thermoanaerobaculia bacterium]|nr:porin [Thermoanaerobaculia bacterium]
MRRILILLALASSLRADTIEDRLKKLEDEVVALKAENEQLRRDLGLEVVARQVDVRTNGAAENMQIGGLIQVQGETGDRGDSRFSSSNSRLFLRRARVNIGGRFVEEFNFRAELELAGSLADTSGLRAQLTDAYLNWNRFDSANIRLGQFKTPFGFEQLAPDPRQYTIERSQVSDRLTPGRQIGAQVGGQWWVDRINYAIGMFNGNGTNSNFNDNDRFMTAGRFSIVPFSGRLRDTTARWSVGADAFRTVDANATFTGRRRAFGIDSQIEIGRLELWGESLRENFDPRGGVATRSSGRYGQAAYYVVPDKLQVVGRYETLDSNRESTLGMNYYFKQHDVKLQLDFMHAPNDQKKFLARL